MRTKILLTRLLKEILIKSSKIHSDFLLGANFASEKSVPKFSEIRRMDVFTTMFSCITSLSRFPHTAFTLAKCKHSRKDFERLSKCGDKSKLPYSRVYILIGYRFSIHFHWIALIPTFVDICLDCYQFVNYTESCLRSEKALTCCYCCTLGASDLSRALIFLTKACRE